MGRRRQKLDIKSHTLPSSPTHSFSSSSSDFEFTVAVSPRKSLTNLCPADELFYKGQLLPLHLSPRLSMVRTLLLTSSSTSSLSDTTTNASRDSTGSTSSSNDLVYLADCSSSRPSSVTGEEDEFKPLNTTDIHLPNPQSIKKSKYFSFSRFSSVFRKESKPRHVPVNAPSSSVKRMSATAKEVIRKYLNKVKPLYEKISQKQHQIRMVTTSKISLKADGSISIFKQIDVPIRTCGNESNATISHSFSGNLRYPTRRTFVSSCPSSMRSSPSHSGVLCRNTNAFAGPNGARRTMGVSYYGGETSSTEEWQSAIQGAITHCKNSMLGNTNMVSADAT